MPMAVVTGGDVGKSQHECLAMECLAISLEAIFVAVPAAFVTVQLEHHLVGVHDLVRGVAVGADRGIGIALGE